MTKKMMANRVKNEDVKRAYQDCINLCNEIALAGWSYDKRTAEYIAKMIETQFIIYPEDVDNPSDWAVPMVRKPLEEETLYNCKVRNG